MSPLMLTIYEYVSRSRVPCFIDYVEYEAASDRAERLQEELSHDLSEEARRTLREYQDALAEQSSVQLEAMFQAAFAAAREMD